MILTETEVFTAEEAVKAGAADAVNAGSTEIAGYYELTPDGIKFQQKKFAFHDKYNNTTSTTTCALEFSPPMKSC